MGVDSRNRQAESGATANPWWPWLYLDAYELVVHPRMGRIFPVNQWDPRAGKTYLLNDPNKIAPTLTLSASCDTRKLPPGHREEFGKDKIFVLGHSWGSYLGLELAKRHADWLHAYIGVGQLTDGPESERRGWSFALDAARKALNQEAVQELEAIAPYFAPNQSTPLAHLYVSENGWIPRWRHG